MKNFKRLLAVALVLCMVLGVMPLSTIAAETSKATTTENSEDYRILHLDCGRKYFTKDWIIALINEMAAAGYTHLQLAFSNDGLRFLLDDMSVGSYSDDQVTAAVQAGNIAYNNSKNYSTSVNELTEEEMDEILAHAKTKGIEIIPLFNNPGHMYTMITAMTNLGMTPSYNGSSSTIDLDDADAVAFVKGLLQKYVTYFAGKGSTVFNIGADEYANDNYSSGSMGFGHLMSSGKYQLFVDYVNELNAMIKAAGMKTMAFNDGIYFQNQTSYAFDKDIMISFWSSGWGSGSTAYTSASASTMASLGHPMINTNGDYYYILGVNDCFTPGTNTYHADGYHTAAEGFSNTAFMSSTVSDPAGSTFCVWSDHPGAETETEVARYIRPILRVMGARMQDTTSYDVDTIVAGGFNADGTINVVETPDPEVPTEPETVTKTDEATKVEITAPGLETVEVEENAAVVTEEKVTKTYSITLNGGAYTGKATVKIPYDTAFDGCNVFTGKFGEDSFPVTKDGNFFICEVPHFSDVEIKGTILPDQYNGSVSTTTTQGESYWALVTNGASGIESGKKYLIASGRNNSVRLLSKSGGTSSAVTVSNSRIESAGTDYQFTLESSGSGWTIKDSGGTYLYPTYSSLSRRFATGQATGQTVTINGSSYVTIYRRQSSRDCYIRYSSNSFSVYSSASNLYLFEEVSVPGTTVYTVGLSGINALIKAVPTAQGNYTDETWAAFQTALTAANTAVTGTADSYNAQANATTQQTAVNAAALDLYNAWQGLQEYATIEITIKYELEDGTKIKTETVNVSEKATSVALSNFNDNGKFYTVESATLAITPADQTVYTVKVTEAEEDLSIVDPLEIEYWITNQVVTIDGVTSKTISASSVYSEAGVDFAALVPASDGAAVKPKVLWKGYLLPSGYHQEGDSAGGKDMTTDENGNRIQKIRYWNGAWQYTVDGSNWIQIKSSDQVVAYYMQQTAVTAEVTTNVVDWGEPFSDWKAGTGESWFWDGYVETGTKYIFLDFAVVYEDGTQNPSAFPTDNTWFMHFDGHSASNPRVLKLIAFTDNEEFEIWKVTETDGTSTGYSSASNFESTYDDSTEKVVWDESMGGEPRVDALTYTANRSGKLIRVYVRAVQKEDSLTVVYYDEKFNDTLYSYSINVERGHNFNDNMEGEPSSIDNRLNVTGCGIVNNLGVTQYFETNLTKVPEAVGKYRNDLYTYTGSEIKDDGKTLYLYYNINTSVLSPNFVVDFGLPITFELEELLGEGTEVGDVTNVSGLSARYGTLTYSNGIFTYTPTSVLQNIDVLSIALTINGKTNTTNVGVTPATTVYYEEGFLENWSGTWTDKGTKHSFANQTAQILGSSTDNYGYDSIITSNGSDATTSTIGASATFTFIGTGFDLYANCDGNTGYVLVEVRDSANVLKRVFMVNTKVATAENATDATSGQTGAFKSLPVVTLEGLTHGAYTVTVKKITDEKAINIDGFRIYGTIKEDITTNEDGTVTNNSIYKSDLEDNPEFHEIRDMVLTGIAGNSDYSSVTDLAGSIHSQIFESTGNLTGAIVLSGNGKYTAAQVQDLLDNGPKNELFLYEGQSVTFSVTTNRVMQIGLKAPQGATKYSISYKVGDQTTAVATDKDISTSVDMFYDVVGQATSVTEYTVTITNAGTGILSVTDLKICDDPNATFNALTAADIEAALNAMGYADAEPENPETPAAPEDSDDSKTPEDPKATCADHKGGTATCKDKAVCTVCGEAYGELDAENHTGEAKWSHTDGKHSKAYDCCGKVVVAEEAHKLTDGKCECGYEAPASDDNSQTSGNSQTSDNSQTGDNSHVVLFGSLLVISALAAIVLLVPDVRKKLIK